MSHNQPLLLSIAGVTCYISPMREVTKTVALLAPMQYPLEGGWMDGWIIPSFMELALEAKL